MKKGKFLSILTTVAMAGSMVLSVVPFTASAYVGVVVDTAGKFYKIIRQRDIFDNL